VDQAMPSTNQKFFSQLCALSVVLAAGGQACLAENSQSKDTGKSQEHGFSKLGKEAGDFTPLKSALPTVVPKVETQIERSSQVKGETQPEEQVQPDAKTQTSSVTSGATAANDSAEEEEVKKAASLANQAADHYAAAAAYFSRGEFSLAETELKSTIMCAPNTQAAHRDYIFVAIMRGQLKRALAEFMVLVGLGSQIPYDDSQKDKQLLAAFKAHYEKGIELGRKDKWKEAVDEFHWALFYQPKSAKAMRSLAFASASAGDFAAAERSYAESFAIDPKDAYSHADMAFMLAKSGREKGAVEQMEAAVKLRPDVPALRVDLGWLVENRGDLSRAEEEFSQAVRLLPKQAALWAHLGRLRTKLGREQDAKSAYDRARALDPGLLEVLSQSAKE
jgi:Flp pilus assembly protein TadD